MILWFTKKRERIDLSASASKTCKKSNRKLKESSLRTKKRQESCIRVNSKTLSYKSWQMSVYKSQKMKPCSRQWDQMVEISIENRMPNKNNWPCQRGKKQSSSIACIVIISIENKNDKHYKPRSSKGLKILKLILLGLRSSLPTKLQVRPTRLISRLVKSIREKRLLLIGFASSSCWASLAISEQATTPMRIASQLRPGICSKMVEKFSSEIWSHFSLQLTIFSSSRWASILTLQEWRPIKHLDLLSSLYTSSDLSKMLMHSLVISRCSTKTNN